VRAVTFTWDSGNQRAAASQIVADSLHCDSMATEAIRILSEALKLSVQERVRVAERLLASADAEGYENETEVAIHAAWADEIQKRSGDLKDGSVRGLSIEEARRIVASDPPDDDR
jgi:putative addiction module component (TIGR02574 family)